MLPAFAHIGAAGGFTDSVEIKRAHDALEIVIFFAAKEFYAKPIGAWVGVGRLDGCRNAIGDDIEGSGHGS